MLSATKGFTKNSEDLRESQCSDLIVNYQFQLDRIIMEESKLRKCLEDLGTKQIETSAEIHITSLDVSAYSGAISDCSARSRQIQNVNLCQNILKKVICAPILLFISENIISLFKFLVTKLHAFKLYSQFTITSFVVMEINCHRIIAKRGAHL